MLKQNILPVAINIEADDYIAAPKEAQAALEKLNNTPIKVTAGGVVNELTI